MCIPKGTPDAPAQLITQLKCTGHICATVYIQLIIDIKLNIKQKLFMFVCGARVSVCVCVFCVMYWQVLVWFYDMI